MNITLAIDERVAREARAAARAMGKSLNQVIREHLEALAGIERMELEVEELRRTAGTGDSRGWRFEREAAYDDRLERFPRGMGASEGS